MMKYLLAVDLGIRTGLALYEETAGLQWYRSQNYGSSARLRRAVHGLIGELRGLEHIVIEGGGPLADIWQREAQKRGIRVMVTGAEAWRKALLYPRVRRTGTEAKQGAQELARRVIELSGTAPRPTSLRHDAAEAILIGLWGTMEVGWLSRLPDALRK